MFRFQLFVMKWSENNIEKKKGHKVLIFEKEEIKQNPQNCCTFKIKSGSKNLLHSEVMIFPLSVRKKWIQASRKPHFNTLFMHRFPAAARKQNWYCLFPESQLVKNPKYVNFKTALFNYEFVTNNTYVSREFALILKELLLERSLM